MEDTIKILQMMIDSYNQRGGGYSQKQALTSALSILKKIDVSKIFNSILNQKPRGLLGNSTGGGTMIDAYPDEYKLAQAIVDYLTPEEI